MTFHPTVLMNSQVILTFALANKPRKLSRTEDSACTASWGLDLLSLHFIATAKQAQGTHCHLGLKSSYSPCICNSQLQKFHIPNPSFCLLLGGTGNSHPGLSMRSKHLSTTELHSSYPSSFFKQENMAKENFEENVCVQMSYIRQGSHICMYRHIHMYTNVHTSELGKETNPNQKQGTLRGSKLMLHVSVWPSTVPSH